MPSFIILMAMAAAVAVSTYPIMGMAKRGGGGGEKQPAGAAKRVKPAAKRGGTKKAKPMMTPEMTQQQMQLHQTWLSSHPQSLAIPLLALTATPPLRSKTGQQQRD